MRGHREILKVIPITSWLPKCSCKAFRADVVAGIALAGLLIPEGMAYAGIAGVPPQVGLYAALLGMLVYAIFGTSRQLAVTSTSSSAAMLAALVAPIALADSGRYMMLVSVATIAAGLTFLLGGLLRLGGVSEFISKPVLKGFVFGLALTIMVKQAHKLMGIPAGKGNFFQQSWHVITALGDANLWTVSVGIVAIAIMFLLGALAPRIPSALVVLVLGILSVPWFGLARHGVEIVGNIHAGMPSLTLPRIGEEELADVFIGAIGIVLVLVAETLAAGRTFCSQAQLPNCPKPRTVCHGCGEPGVGAFRRNDCGWGHVGNRRQ